MNVEDEEEAERLRRLDERWRFDSDDVPAARPNEQDRVLIDDYDSK